MLRRFVCWRGLDAWRAEAALVERDANGLRARGTQIATGYRAEYELDTDARLLTRSLTVRTDTGERTRSLSLVRWYDGHWTASGEPLPKLEDALDCDLAFSPLTNLMPAARLGAEPADHLMAWVSLPDLAVSRSPQRYEPIAPRHLRYVALDGDFTAELTLDGDGLVLAYPGLAERV